MVKPPGTTRVETRTKARNVVLLTNCLVIGYALLVIFSARVRAEDADVIEDDNIQVFLTNERGDPQTTFYFNPGQKVVDEVAFRHRTGTKPTNYTSWVLEISEPKEKLSYRMAFNSQLPFLIHWDGMFDSDRGIIPNQRYFLRLMLITKDKKVFSSPYSFFLTAERDLEIGTQVELVQVEAAKLFLQLSGGFKTISAKTPGYNSTLFPNLDGDVGVYWKEDHRFGVRFDVTSNILSGWNFDTTGTVLRYSDFSVGYRYRLMGQPPRRPQLPYVPPYLKGAIQPSTYDAKYFGAPINCEIGFKIFNSLLSSAEGQPISKQLPGQMKGVSATANVDFVWDRLRLYGTLEFGSSIFGGKVNRIGIEGIAVYDRWQSIAPGLLVSLTSFSGAPDPEFNPGVTSVSAKLIFIGAYLIFKV